MADNSSPKHPRDYTTSTDEELMLSYQGQDQLAFNELFLRWKDRIWSYVSKHIYSGSDREDVVQKIFLKLHGHRDKYQNCFLFSQWIFTITKSVIIDHLRSTKNHVKHTALENASDIVAQNDYEAEGAMASVDLSTLSENQQEVLRLRYEQDMEFEEIARILNKKEVSIRKILSRSFEKLRRSKVLGGV